MIIKSYECDSYNVEIHEHPIYHDFEFVVKSLDGHEVIGASTRPYEQCEDAENAAFLFIKSI